MSKSISEITNEMHDAFVKSYVPLDFTVRGSFTLTRGQINNIINVLGGHTVAHNGHNNDDVLNLINNLEGLIE
tara:strand:+ start:151 stop:369 length:219 start_codon:yes stop_codon:yes gene_type:complete